MSFCRLNDLNTFLPVYLGCIGMIFEICDVHVGHNVHTR